MLALAAVASAENYFFLNVSESKTIRITHNHYRLLFLESAHDISISGDLNGGSLCIKLP